MESESARRHNYSIQSFYKLHLIYCSYLLTYNNMLVLVILYHKYNRKIF